MNEIEKKKMYKKVKWNLLFAVGIIYLFFGMDNLLVSYAALTMRADLSITDSFYGVIRSAGFLAALLFQIPYNIMIKKIGARKLLPTVALIWSVTSLLLFFARSPVEVAISRFLNGIGDAGFFVGVMYWVTLWLPSRDRAAFTSVFIATGAIAAILGSPICGIIVARVNWLGIAGWRWLFLLPSTFSLFIGLLGYLVIRNRPEDAKWLSEQEKAVIHEDLEYEKDLVVEKTTMAAVKQVLTNRTLWKLGIIYFFAQAGMLTASSWMTMIIQGFAPNLDAAQIGYIGAAPALLSVIFSIWIGAHSDKKRERKWHIIIPLFCSAAAFVLFMLPIGLWIKVVVLGILGSFGLSSWYGPFWTLPAALLPSKIVNVGIAVICCMSSLAGFLGNLLAGVVSQRFGNTGLLLFMSLAVIAATALSFTVDYKTVAKVDRGKEEGASPLENVA